MFFFCDNLWKFWIQQTFVLMKASWRRLSFSSEDVFIRTNIFALLIPLQKTSSRRLDQYQYIRLGHTSSRRFEDVFKTSSKRLQDIFKTSYKKVFKKSSRRFEDVFKASSAQRFSVFANVFNTSSIRACNTSSKNAFKTSWRRLEDVFARRLQGVFKTSSGSLSRRLEDVFKNIFKRSSRRLGRQKSVTLKTS